MKILLVDDEPIELDNLEHILALDKSRKWQTLRANNGYEALRLLEKQQADVALLDIRMPGMDGIELARLLKLDYPSLEIIILSAYGEFQYAQEAMNNGVFKYLLKPTVPEQVLSAVHQLVDRMDRQKERENEWKKQLDVSENDKPNAWTIPTGYSELIRKCIEYMEEHYAEKLSLVELAEVAYVHPSYLSRLFRKETGTNYIEFLNHIRIEKAKKILLKTDLSIEAISEKVGFNSPNYFSVAFKKAVGIAPGTFRAGGR